MKKLSLKLAVVALSLTALSGSAYAGSVQSGTLICELRGKTNLILYSKRKFDCRFDPAGSRAVESYGGGNYQYRRRSGGHENRADHLVGVCALRRHSGGSFSGNLRWRRRFGRLRRGPRGESNDRRFRELHYVATPVHVGIDGLRRLGRDFGFGTNPYQVVGRDRRHASHSSPAPTRPTVSPRLIPRVIPPAGLARYLRPAARVGLNSHPRR